MSPVGERNLDSFDEKAFLISSDQWTYGAKEYEL